MILDQIHRLLRLREKVRENNVSLIDLNKQYDAYIHILAEMPIETSDDNLQIGMHNLVVQIHNIELDNIHLKNAIIEEVLS